MICSSMDKNSIPHTSRSQTYQSNVYVYQSTHLPAFLLLPPSCYGTDPMAHLIGHTPATTTERWWVKLHVAAGGGSSSDSRKEKPGKTHQRCCCCQRGEVDEKHVLFLDFYTTQGFFCFACFAFRKDGRFGGGGGRWLSWIIS